MGMSKVKYKYSISLFLGLLNVILFIFWMMIPDKNYMLFLVGFIILVIGHSFIANAYAIIKENYEERIARKIRNKIRLWGFTITILLSGVVYFYGALLTVGIA